jgi:mycothiol synthase
VSDLRWISPYESGTDERMEAEGFDRVRLLRQMRRSLPLDRATLAGTTPIAVREFRTDDPDDAEGFLVVNNRAFRWHPEQGGWDRDRLAGRISEDWFDPRGFLLHDGPDGRIDGFCWTKVHPPGHDAADDPTMGEIFVIAADPDTRGTGLGRSLTVAGLEHLAQQGLAVAMLYVEADNSSAIGLYERLGFTVHHDVAGYRARIDPDHAS